MSLYWFDQTRQCCQIKIRLDHALVYGTDDVVVSGGVAYVIDGSPTIARDHSMIQPNVGETKQLEEKMAVSDLHLFFKLLFEVSLEVIRSIIVY